MACSASAKRMLCADASESMGTSANATGVMMTRSTLTTIARSKGLIDTWLDLQADQHIANPRKRVLISPGCSS